MKKLSKALLAFALAGSALFPLSAKSAREEMKPSKNWNLYLPGKKTRLMFKRIWKKLAGSQATCTRITLS